MKTQFVVSITQSGDDLATPAALERDLRTAAREHFQTYASPTTVTVRHLVEGDQPEVPNLKQALIEAHRAGQLTGRLLGKEGRERADAYATETIAALSAPAQS